MATGRSYELSPILEPLEGFTSSTLTVISGLGQPSR
jgi:hypothetical protein